MLIETVNSNRVNTYTNMAVQEKERAADVFAEGQIVSGTVTKISEQVTLDFEGRQVDFPKESVKNAREGEVRKFQVVRADDKGVILKELGSTEEGKAVGVSFTQVDAAAGAVVKEKEEGEKRAEEENPDEITERMTEEDYRALEAEGITLESYNLERLARALERIKEGRIQKQVDLAQMVEKQTRTREEIRKIAEQSVSGATALTEYLVQLFVQADIPVTEAKIEEAVQAVRLGQQTGQLDEGAKAYLIRNAQEPNVRNLYRAAHSGERVMVQAMEESAWEQLQSAVRNVLEQAGRTADEDGFLDARWLLERDIPLTPENLIYKQELDALTQQEPEQILQQVGEAWQHGQSAEEALLCATPKELWQQTQVRMYQQEFAGISMETADAAVQALQAQNGTGELSLSFLKKIQEQFHRNELVIQDVTVRRQLTEIQLKLTMDTGVRLMERGIRLDTDGLQKIVDGLRSIEQEYYEKLYQEAGGTINDATRGEIELLARTCGAVEEVKGAPAYLLGATFTTRNIQTLDNLAEAGRHAAAEFVRAEQTYEAVMTKPRADMGDSIATAFRHMDSLMQEMGLEQTEANRRAIRILSYNHLELSAENIQEMKLYDAKVQQLLDGLNPVAAVNLIRKQINPLELPIDELNAVLRQLKEEGATTEEKYSTYLVKLDQKKELTPEERDSYIGIYRLLHQVTKTDGAALGAVVHSGREVTLANLLSAVRTRRSGGVDADINDAFGGLTGLERKGTDILEQAGAAFSYQHILAEQILERLTPQSYAAVQEEGKAPEQMSLEQLQEALAAADHSAEEVQYAQFKLGQMNEALQGSTEEIAFLNIFGQEKTISMIQSARELLSADSTKKRLNTLAEKYHAEMSEAFSEIPDPDTVLENAENMQKQVEKWNESADKVIDELFGAASLSGEDGRQLIQLRNTIRLTGQLAKREFYEIPLQGENGFVKMNLTVLRKAGQSGRVSIQLKQAAAQDVSVELSVNEKTLQGYVTSASKEGLERLQQREVQIKEKLTEQGFDVTQWNYGLKTRSADTYIYKDGSIYRRNDEGADKAQESGVTRTDDLYLAAKTIIKTVSAM